MGIYVNRILNMKHIKTIGFDMDHTLVKYHSDKFEELTFHEAVKILLRDRDYPEIITKCKFDFSRAVRGIVLISFNNKEFIFSTT